MAIEKSKESVEAGSEVYLPSSTYSPIPMVLPEELVGDEWAEWYRLTPLQRWAESSKLWQIYLELGGNPNPESDTQSPFFDARAPRPMLADERSGLRVLRRGRV
jgi:hypothetical protein